MAIRLDDPGRSFLGHFERVDLERFSGWVFAPDDPDRRFVVEIRLDGEGAGLLRAEQFVPALFDQGRGDGCYGFTFTLPKRDLRGRSVVEARLANTGERIGAGLSLAGDALSGAEERSGRVAWAGGLKLAGWTKARADADRVPKVRVFHRDVPVTEAAPLRWSALAEPPPADDLVPFELVLPESFADGRVRLLTVLDETDRPLEGSPVAVLVHPSGLTRLLAPGGDEDLVPAAVFERLFPRSVPFSETAAWRSRFAHPRQGHGRSPIRVVVIGRDDWLDEAAESLEAQTYPAFSLAAVVAEDGWNFAWSDLEEALRIDGASEPYLCFVGAETRLDPLALESLAAVLDDNDDAILAYADFVVGAHPHAEPVCQGTFDYERFLEQGTFAHLALIRRDVLAVPSDEVMGSIFRIVSACLDESGPHAAARCLAVPDLLADVPPCSPTAAAALASSSAAHLVRRGQPAEVLAGVGNLLPAVRVRRQTPPYGVSVVVTSRDRPDRLARAIDGVRRTAWAGDIEIIVADADSALPETLAFLEEMKRGRVRVVGVPGPYNPARARNRAASQARGDLLCFLDDDVTVDDPEWLVELASRLSDATVGAVGPLLCEPGGLVHSAGIVLGPQFDAVDALGLHLADEAGYNDLLRVAREPSAVSDACFVTRRSDFAVFGGFDEARFPRRYAQVDYCLRLRRAGKRIVFTPHARLVRPHSPAHDEAAGSERIAERDLATLRLRWGETLAADPAYSPLLNRDGRPYAGLAWPPGERRARRGLTVEAVRPERLAPALAPAETGETGDVSGRAVAAFSPDEASEKLRQRLRALTAPPRS